MIERYQLRYFLAVVDAGNFSRAALQVNVTQPTLSIAIAKLEAALQARLFLRNSQRVELTEAGARLVTHARSVESEFAGLAARIASKASKRLLRIGVLLSIPTRLIERVLAVNAASGDPDELEIVEGAERDLVHRLQRQRIDVALTLLRPGEARFPTETLFQEGYALATAADHPYAGEPAVPGEALRHEVMIVRRHCEVLSETSRYFTQRGVRPRFSFRSTNDDRTVALVKAGLGITVMPESFVDPSLARPKLAGFDITREIGLIWAAAPPEAPSPAVDALRSLRGRSA